MNHARCFCQRRAFHAFRRLAEQEQTTSKANIPKASPPRVGSQAAQSRAPSPKDWLPRKGEDFKPQPLGRPIGFNRPPKPGENGGNDGQSAKQRRAGLTTYERHLEKRQKL